VATSSTLESWNLAPQFTAKLDDARSRDNAEGGVATPSILGGQNLATRFAAKPDEDWRANGCLHGSLLKRRACGYDIRPITQYSSAEQLPIIAPQQQTTFRTRPTVNLRLTPLWHDRCRVHATLEIRPPAGIQRRGSDSQDLMDHQSRTLIATFGKGNVSVLIAGPGGHLGRALSLIMSCDRWASTKRRIASRVSIRAVRQPHQRGY